MKFKNFLLILVGMASVAIHPDQWQVTSNSGSARLFPSYAAHAMGVQTNFIAPKQGLNFFFKYYGEYSGKAHPQGRTIVFGGSWTLKIPKG